MSTEQDVHVDVMQWQLHLDMSWQVTKIVVQWIVDTYSDQNAVQIHLLAPVHARAPEDVREAVSVVHAQDVDVVLAAESLNESEVYLKRHILRIIVVSCQDAQHHVIRIPEQKSWDFSYLY